jgi:large subunit ribosomal protein L32e
MSYKKALLEKRKATKRKKPSFMRKDIYKKARIGKSWRKPRGLDNKQRLCKRGHAKKISNGYRAPKDVRGLHKSGLMPVIVSNISQLNSLTKEQGAILSAKIGDRKRQMLIIEAKKKDITLLNLDADETLENIQKELKQRQELRKKSLEADVEKKKSVEDKLKKAEPAKETEKEAEKETKNEEELSDEDKKKLEKEEKDKLLTKRE